MRSPLLWLCVLPACGEAPGAPDAGHSSENDSSSAIPRSDTSGALTGFDPPRPPDWTGVLGLRHRRAFETYDLTHVGIDQYFHKRTLSLVTTTTDTDDAMMSCRTFDYVGTPQVVCAVHGDLPKTRGCPKFLPPAPAASRRATAWRS